MWLIARTTAVSATARVAAPAASNGLAACARVVGSSFIAPMISSAAIGRLIRNSHCQENCSRMPPRIGPIRNATPNTAPTIPRAGPRSWSGSRAAITAVATGKMPPAPKPWMARPATSAPELPATTSTSDPAANNAMLRI